MGHVSTRGYWFIYLCSDVHVNNQWGWVDFSIDEGLSRLTTTFREGRFWTRSVRRDVETEGVDSRVQ